ncbi:hypothetical protein FSP39_006653 [Pinctada imbricata]|uniref:Large ribosomal subunit protein uL23m n=1 Tax=Pinctada imbricata TaxID=66713 RepID=A0AA88Y3I6_PINIB|nr:hypothetical protein FSP39_006653 [Pinctada imbricata]
MRIPAYYMKNAFHKLDPKQFRPVLDKTPLWERPIPKYPVYKDGGPQTRVFLCHFWMKMLKPNRRQAKDVVNFEVHPQMSKFDIKQYLEKLYQVSVLHVSTKLAPGTPVEKEGAKGRKYYSHQRPDRRLAYVTLGRGQTFEFPDLFKDKEKLQHTADQNQSDEEATEKKRVAYKHFDKLSIPPWFR